MTHVALNPQVLQPQVQPTPDLKYLQPAQCCGPVGSAITCSTGIPYWNAAGQCPGNGIMHRILGKGPSLW